MDDKPTVGMKNLKSRKLYMQVYDELRDYILQQQLSPGDMLPTEMEMCATLGVSRNVLREAIKALEITGIVSSTPGVGIMIQEFNPDFLFQTLFYNLTNDSEALLKQTLAVRRTLELGFLHDAFDSLKENDIKQLEKQVIIMDKVCKEKIKSVNEFTFGPDFYRADANFHNILYQNTKNSILCSIINAIWQCDQFHKKAIHAKYMESTVNKHRIIVDALKAHDFNAFSDAMQHHFNDEYKSEDSELTTSHS